MARQGLAGPGQAGQGMDDCASITISWQGGARRGKARHGQAGRGSARLGTAWRGMDDCASITISWQGGAGPGGARRGRARLGGAWQGAAGQGMDSRVSAAIPGRGLAEHGAAWRGAARPGKAGLGSARHGDTMTQHTDNEPCRCWSCRRELGQTDGQALYLNDRASIRRPMTLWCVCGGATFWRPAKRATACDGQELLTAT